MASAFWKAVRSGIASDSLNVAVEVSGELRSECDREPHRDLGGDSL